MGTGTPDAYGCDTQTSLPGSPPRLALMGTPSRRRAGERVADAATLTGQPASIVETVQAGEFLVTVACADFSVSRTRSHPPPWFTAFGELFA